MRKIIYTFYLCLIASTGVGQIYEWEIDREFLVNITNNTQKVDSINIGNISIDFKSRIVKFNTKSYKSSFEFNDCEESDKSDTSFTFKLHNFGVDHNSRAVTIGTVLSNDFGGFITIYTNSNMRVFVLKRTDKAIKNEDYYYAVKGAFEKIYFPWIVVSESADGNIEFIKAEPAKQRYYKSEIPVWTKKILKTYKYNSIVYKNAEAKVLVTYDCVKNRYKIEQATYYTTQGKVIYSNKFYNDWDSVIPASVGEKMLNKVCELFEAKGH